MIKITKEKEVNRELLESALTIVIRRYFKEYNPTTKRVAVFNRGCTSWSNDCGFPDYFDVDEVCLA